jgi:transcription antitermination factor NusG
LSGWFVVETHPRAEFRAQANLDRQGFTSFLPRFRKMRRHARRIEEILAPVFPGYLFLSLDRDRDRWHPINSTFGVRRIVSFANNRPQSLPDATMAAIMSRCESQTIVRQIFEIAVGDEVCVVRGALIDKIGRVEQLDEKGRVAVLMELLGRPLCISMDATMLGPVRC